MSDPKAIRVQEETITPDLAAYLLKHNTNNRKLTQRRVSKLADAIRAGKWKLTHQGLAISPDGVLLDGQHRLAAIVESGIAVQMLVAYDVDPLVFDVIDTGRSRNFADVLSVNDKGTLNHRIAAAVRLLWLLVNNFRSDASTNVAPDNVDLLSLLAQHKELPDCISEGRLLAKEIRMHEAAATVSVYMLRSSIASPDIVDAFLEGTMSGVGLEKGDPRLALRNVMVNAAISKRTRPGVWQVALFIKAWNSYITGKPVSHLRWANSEPVPSIRIGGKHGTSAD